MKCDKMDERTLGWILEAIESCPNKECTIGLIETIEWLYDQSKDLEMLEYLMGRIIEKQKLL